MVPSWLPLAALNSQSHIIYCSPLRTRVVLTKVRKSTNTGLMPYGRVIFSTVTIERNNKQLLDSFFVILGLIKVEVIIIRRSRRLITLTETKIRYHKNLIL